MGQNYVRITDLVIPVHCEETLVVERSQGPEEVVDRKFAFAEKDVHAVLAVAYAHMADVGAEGLDGGLCGLPALEISGPDVPGGSDGGRGEGVDYLEQVPGPGKRTRGLEEDSYVLELCASDGILEKNVKSLHVGLVAYAHDYVLDSAEGCHVHVLQKRDGIGLCAVRIHRIPYGADIHAVVAQHAAALGDLLGPEDAVRMAAPFVDGIPDLEPVQAVFACQAAERGEIGPVDIFC